MKMNQTLYDITGEYAKLLDQVYIDPDTGEIIEPDGLADAEKNFAEKVENLALWIKNREAEAAAIEEEAGKLKARAEKQARLSQWGREYLMNCLKAAGQRGFSTARAEISMRRSKSVLITDEKAIPGEFFVETVTRKPSKAMILRALKEGHAVAGAELVEKDNLQLK